MHQMNSGQGNLDRIEAGLTFAYDPSSPLPEDLLARREAYEGLTEEDRAKHIYAIAGLALYTAQCFEREILQVLLVENRAAGRDWSPEEYDILEGKLSQKTLGRLLQRVTEVVDVNEDGKSLLAHALRARNALAHGFFWTHAKHFMTTAGQRKMMDELLGYIRLFRMADGLCGIIVKVLMRGLGIPVETIDKLYEELLEELENGEAQ